MARRGLILEEQPVIGCRVRVGRMTDQPGIRAHAGPKPEGELAALDGKRQARPACLDVRLLQRPVPQEQPGLLCLRRCQDYPALGRGENMADESGRRALADRLHVDPAVQVQASHARDESVGVRDVESQPVPWRRQFGTAVSADTVTPPGRGDSRSARRQHVPRQSVRRAVGLLVTGEMQALLSGALFRGQRTVRGPPGDRGGGPHPCFRGPDPVTRHLSNVGDS